MLSINFDENVKVFGTPTLDLTIGPDTKTATFLNRKVLTFPNALVGTPSGAVTQHFFKINVPVYVATAGNIAIGTVVTQSGSNAQGKLSKVLLAGETTSLVVVSTSNIDFTTTANQTLTIGANTAGTPTRVAKTNVSGTVVSYDNVNFKLTIDIAQGYFVNTFTYKTR